MAALKEHCCRIFGKSFPFASKLARHLQSAAHKSLCDTLEDAYEQFMQSVNVFEDALGAEVKYVPGQNVLAGP